MAYGRKKPAKKASYAKSSRRGGSTYSAWKPARRSPSRGGRGGGGSPNITIRLIQQAPSELSPMTQLLQAMGRVEAPVKKKAKF